MQAKSRGSARATPASFTISPSAEIMSSFEQKVRELAPPVPVRKGRPGAAAAAAAVAPLDIDSVSEDRRAAAAAFVMLSSSSDELSTSLAAMQRARTAFHTPDGTPPFMSLLLANVRDILQTDDAALDHIFPHFAGVAKLGLGITSAGELTPKASRSVRDLYLCMLEANALASNEEMFEMASNETLMDLIVSAIQSSCAAYVHARSPARAQMDVVVSWLESRAPETIDWNAKIAEAVNAHRIARMEGDILVVL